MSIGSLFSDWMIEEFPILTGAPANKAQKIEHPGWLRIRNLSYLTDPLVLGTPANVILNWIPGTIERLNLRI